jgi:hypothetical protein
VLRICQALVGRSPAAAFAPCAPRGSLGEPRGKWFRFGTILLAVPARDHQQERYPYRCRDGTGNRCRDGTDFGAGAVKNTSDSVGFLRGGRGNDLARTKETRKAAILALTESRMKHTLLTLALNRAHARLWAFSGSNFSGGTGAAFGSPLTFFGARLPQRCSRPPPRWGNIVPTGEETMTRCVLAVVGVRRQRRQPPRPARYSAPRLAIQRSAIEILPAFE